MNRTILEAVTGSSPRQSAMHGLDQHAYSNHQRAQETKRNKNESKRRTLTSDHSQRHAHDNGIEADNATVTWSRP
jgi:hypothetical protein